MTHDITTRQMPANENGRGNLAGTEIRCSCGYVEGTTLQSEVPFIIHGHLDWAHKVGDARKRKQTTALKAAATRKRNADPFGFVRAGLVRA